MITVVIQLTHIGYGFDHAPDFMVGLRKIGGIDLHHARVDLLLLVCETIPGRDFVGARRQLGVCRDDTELLLVCQGFFSDFVPSLIELALKLVDPFLRCMVRRVRPPSRVVREEGLLRSERMLDANPRDGFVGQDFVEVLRMGPCCSGAS